MDIVYLLSSHLPYPFALNCLHTHQSTTQYRDDDTIITTARGGEVTAEKFVDGFFGAEYKYSNRW